MFRKQTTDSLNAFLTHLSDNVIFFVIVIDLLVLPSCVQSCWVGRNKIIRCNLRIDWICITCSVVLLHVSLWCDDIWYLGGGRGMGAEEWKKRWKKAWNKRGKRGDERKSAGMWYDVIGDTHYLQYHHQHQIDCHCHHYNHLNNNWLTFLFIEFHEFQFSLQLNLNLLVRIESQVLI